MVIDEKSVLGLKTLGWIDRRLREIFPGNRNEIFRGLTVLLIGDFFQLPPVLNKLLYTTNVFLSLKQDELLGRNAYLSFGHSVFLTTIQRQAGDDQASFRKALLELRQARVSVESWELLSSRCAVRLPRWEQESFEDAVRIYYTKERVNAYNHDHMLGLNSPALDVIASRALVPRRAAHKTPAIFLSLSLSAWLMRNIWTEVGLFNGAVYDIGWVGADPLRWSTSTNTTVLRMLPRMLPMVVSFAI